MSETLRGQDMQNIRGRIPLDICYPNNKNAHHHVMKPSHVLDGYSE